MPWHGEDNSAENSERSMKMRAILSFRYLHNIISDFDETSHTLNRNILFIRDNDWL